MKYTALVIVLLSFSIANALKAQGLFNGNLEQLDSTGNPKGWDLTYHQGNKYDIKLDSVIKKEGKYSVSIASNDLFDNGAIVFTIPKTFKGRQVVLIGHLKTENVSGGFAGIWIRVNGPKGKELAFESMKSQNLTGTNDWKEYMISVPYIEQEAISIELGALLIGKGKVWVDSMRLYIDDQPIDEVPLSKYGNYKALQDTAFQASSRLASIPTDPASLKRLSSLGQFWGFLKYHHPAIARGDYNWDAELFRQLPSLINSKTDLGFSAMLEKWVDRLGAVPKCDTCFKTIKAKEIAQKPDYGNLFEQPIFSKSLKSKLKYILKNANNPIQYYVGPSGTSSSPGFIHENEYPDYYPDAGLRLLALYRYWSIIQYFSPNRELTDKDWNAVLPEFVPKVLQAKNARQYVEAITELISSIKDTHGFIGSYVREQLMGSYKLPVQAKFIENQLVVTKYYRHVDEESSLQIGDVITSINGAKVTDLVKKYSPYISASNAAATLRDLPSTYLLAQADSVFKLTVERGNDTLQVVQGGIPRNMINDAYWQAPEGDKSYKLLSKDIGYIHCGKYKNTELDSIKSQFKNTKGMIVDMRGYPVDEMTAMLAAWCKSDSSAFVSFSKPTYNQPGLFRHGELVSNGTKQTDPYTGKVVILVNEITQSNAEFVTMAFQSAPNVKVIGSTTSGADGNITQVVLPGGISTWFSGIGTYYLDGTNAQRAGVKLDKVVKPTIEGVKKGIDEVLEEAKQMIIR